MHVRVMHAWHANIRIVQIASEAMRALQKPLEYFDGRQWPATVAPAALHANPRLHAQACHLQTHRVRFPCAPVPVPQQHKTQVFLLYSTSSHNMRTPRTHAVTLGRAGCSAIASMQCCGFKPSCGPCDRFPATLKLRGDPPSKIHRLPFTSTYHASRAPPHVAAVLSALDHATILSMLQPPLLQCTRCYAFLYSCRYPRARKACKARLQIMRKAKMHDAMMTILRPCSRKTSDRMLPVSM